MNARLWMAVATSLVSTAACVGDSSITTDAGGDATTTDQYVPADAGGDTSADASDGSTCGTCDGSCYHGLCNGNAVVQVAMGFSHACALLVDGSLWCWGDNSAGQIESPPSTTPITTATKVTGVSNVTNVSAGLGTTCVVEADASVWCWGQNLSGALGHAPNTAGDVICGTNTYCNATPSKLVSVAAKQVSAGRWDTCAVTTTGAVVCWGWNGTGVVAGTPSNTNIPTPTLIGGLPTISQVVVSSWPGDNVCAIDTSANLWCWGLNEYDQTGHAIGTDGDVGSCGEPPSGTGSCTKAPVQVSVGGNGIGPFFTNVASVTATWSACAAQLGGSVSCWGSNGAGEFGNGVASQTAVAAPTAVGGLSNVKTISGSETMCALESSGDVWCWGAANTAIPGTYGADAGCLGYVQPLSCALTPVKVAGVEASSLSTGATAAAAITTGGKVVAWGDNTYGELGHAKGSAGDDSQNHNATPTLVQGLP